MATNILVISDSSLISRDFQGMETVRYVICGVSEGDDRRFLQRKILLPQETDYKSRNHDSARIKGKFAFRVLEETFEAKLSTLCNIHTHPERAYFSDKDEKDAERQMAVLPDFHIRFFIRLVLGDNGLVGVVHRLDGNWHRETLDYILIYKPRGMEIIVPNNSDFRPDFSLDRELHNRTLQIGGGMEGALEIIRFAKIGVMGTGGGGAAFLNTCKHLGVRKLVLIDPDVLERSNANRFMGYKFGDEGKPKVEVLKRELLAFNPDMEIETYQEHFPSEATENALKGCDIIATVPDHHYVRIKAAEYCATHLKPLFSGGAGIYVDKDGVPYRIACSVLFQQPSGPCLKCLGIKAGLQPQYEQIVLNARRSYIKGFRNPGPTPASVVTLHNQLGNLLARHILYYLSCIGDVPHHLIYDEIPPKFEDVSQVYSRQEDCPICGNNAFWAYGDDAPRIPTRQQLESEMNSDSPNIIQGVR